MRRSIRAGLWRTLNGVRMLTNDVVIGFYLVPFHWPRLFVVVGDSAKGSRGESL